MTMILHRLIPFFILFALISCSQNSGKSSLEPKPSPLDVTSLKKNDTYLKIVYSRPQKRGREIFGDGLIPYGEVWRTGANEATEITATKDVSLNGNNLPAGTYSLYTIPNEDQWTIIINKALGQWGASEYDPEKDQMRFDVPAESTDDTWEAFTIELDEDAMELRMMWDNTRVSIPVAI